jgi:hypothetical protein
MIRHDRSISLSHDDQIGLVLFCAPQDRMHFTAGDQLGIRKDPSFGHLLFGLRVKRGTLL